MPSLTTNAVALLLLANLTWAVSNDPCAAASSASDVQFKLELKDGRTVFREGEIIPLVLQFTSSANKRYWADVRNYDRSGRLGIASYCVAPESPDPLESYFKTGGFIGGGRGTTRELDTVPFAAEAELNEWRRLAPGRYRVYAVSHRVWRGAEPGEQTPYSRVQEVVRSNTVEIHVNPAYPEWQNEQLQSGIRILASAPLADEARRAVRKIAF